MPLVERAEGMSYIHVSGHVLMIGHHVSIKRSCCARLPIITSLPKVMARRFFVTKPCDMTVTRLMVFYHTDYRQCPYLQPRSGLAIPTTHNLTQQYG